MNKHLVLAAVTALTLASCRKTELIVSPAACNSQDAIGFTSYTGREVTKAAISSGSFKVSAYLKPSSGDETEYYANQLYTWDGSSSYVSDPIHYWPTAGNLDFYAVMPATYSGTAAAIDIVGTSGTPGIRTIAFTADGATDLSAVLLAGRSRPTGATPTNPNLSFSHKLTKVTFKATGSDTRLKYVISGAKISADSKGTYTYSSAGGSWTLDASEPMNTEYDVVDSSSQPETLDYGTTSAAKIGTTLYLLPVQSAADTTVKFTITYKVYQKDAESTAGDHLVAKVTKSVNLTPSVSGKWDMNRSVVYNLTLPIAATEITFTATVSDWDADVEYPNIPPAAKPGKFRVNAGGTQVYFSKGNLQATYDASSGKYIWGFAAHQYDYVGNAAGNTTIGSQIDGAVVDLFGWVGTSSKFTGDAAYGVSADPNNSAYAGIFGESLKQEWGTAIDDKGTWRTLSRSEWQYLISSRLRIRQSSSGRDTIRLMGGGTVNGINGLILLPDDWNGSACPGFAYTKYRASSDTGFVNVLTLAQWSAMEAVGAVFLPAAGDRSGSTISNSGFKCSYWTSTFAINGTAGLVEYPYNTRLKGFFINTSCNTGASVRLVSVVKD